MKKMRVFELAKKLSVDSTDVLKITSDLAILAENNMSMLDVHDIERINKRVEKDKDRQEEKKDEDNIVQQRVSSKVIRRRARKKPQAPELKAPEPKAQEAAGDTLAKAVVPGDSPETKTAESGQPVEEAAKTAEEIPATGILSEKNKVKPEQPSSGEQPASEEQPAPVKAVDHEALEKPEKPEEPEKPEGPEKEKKDKNPLKTEDKETRIKHIEHKVLKAKKEKESRRGSRGSMYSRSKTKKQKKTRSGKPRPVVPVNRKVRIDRRVAVATLAQEMGIKAGDLIRVLKDLDVDATQNRYINADEAILAAAEFGVAVEQNRDEIQEDYLTPLEYAPEDLSSRPAIVTVMGHVDHGKTSILDVIRNENITEDEFGGITQHIGAYQAQCNNRLITFIDTPGHEAFTSMRARGAQVTDFVVLVVAADDGVMDQTKEAINHSKAAGIPILVAVNKIDKPNANPQRVKEQLSEYGLVPEDWGGETIFIEVSATQHTGIDDLLEMILLQADILDIKACSTGSARGVVLESRLDKNRGPMSTVIVHNGTLKTGDFFVVGKGMGKARAMYDFNGNAVSSARPGMPVEVMGFSGLASAGDDIFVVPDEKKAKEIVAYLKEEEGMSRMQASGTKTALTLEDIYGQMQQGEIKTLKLIVKADVHGTIEAIRGSLAGIETGDNLSINIIHSAVGGITENDILLASTSDAIVIGFNVRPDSKARNAAKKHGIDLKLYSVIYDIIEDIKKALTGMIVPEYEDIIQGRASVRDIFKVPKAGVIAGCMVIEGRIVRNAKARLLRDNRVIHEGAVDSLKRFKDDAKEVANGYECGIGLGTFNDIKVGDVIEAYTMEQKEINPAWL
ncbi:MAG: translation initiation factor IF-2 [Thermodesulfobacteriota bacterium]|nr:translation initiation factor IF-2 [Thermodesulfobacteriota bacterium]